MTREEPIACSLGASDLRQRLSEIAAVGADSLIERSIVGDRHLLRFRSNARTRRRLEAIIAAEAQCCAFLHLSLDEQGDELALSIDAPEDGQLTADALAAAFTATRPAEQSARGGQR
jgi:hypothetical protein